jgi:hypothetical protein
MTSKTSGAKMKKLISKISFFNGLGHTGKMYLALVQCRKN